MNGLINEGTKEEYTPSSDKKDKGKADRNTQSSRGGASSQRSKIGSKPVTGDKPLPKKGTSTETEDETKSRNKKGGPDKPKDEEKTISDRLNESIIRIIRNIREQAQNSTGTNINTSDYDRGGFEIPGATGPTSDTTESDYDRGGFETPGVNLDTTESDYDRGGFETPGQVKPSEAAEEEPKKEPKEEPKNRSSGSHILDVIFGRSKLYSK